MKKPISIAVVLCLIVCGFGLIGCDGTPGGREETGRTSQALTLLASDSFDSYSDGQTLNGKSGGSGWNDEWNVISGAVTLSDDQSHTGSLSAKFGATSNDVASRAFTYTNGDMFEIYIYAPSTTDAMANMELRSEYYSTQFLARFNYLTAGNVSVYDTDQSSWYDVASFTPNAWNKMGYRVDPDSGMMDVFVNNVQVASGLRLMDEWSTIGRVVLESATANGEVLYMDSPQQVQPTFDSFDAYSDTDSFAGLAGGAGWNSNWSVMSGSVTVSDDQAQSGTLSAKFGATSNDRIKRDFDLPEDQFFEIYVYAPADLDAMAAIEFRHGTYLEFLVRFNYQSAGDLSVFDQDVMSWSDVGAFNANAWNKLSCVIKSSNHKMDYYLNDVLVLSDAGSVSGAPAVDSLRIETVTANSAVLYVDSPKVILP